MKKSILAFVLCGLLNTPVLAEQSNELGFSSQQVSEGLVMLSGVGGFTGGNIAISIQPDSVAMIDDGIVAVAGKLQAAVKNVTDRPLDYLINTHIHQDHIGNNALFAKQGARIIAQDNLRERLLTDGIKTDTGKADAPAPAVPVITFDQAMTLHFKNDSAKLMYIPSAHTDGDSFVLFESANVIHTGDVFFNGLYPYIDFSSGGSLDGYIAGQKRIAELANDETKIIPGHGPLATKQDLLASTKMLEETKSIIQGLLAQGKTPEQIAELDPLKDYNTTWSWGFITREKMLQQLLTGLGI